mmetsp:Transcript_16078/g.37271  ORF Transcript_16078/g.37271 Transcript_16078/m.37271 type:complete len:2258 (+) Transcript_16078:270-7043(+)|eukprot:CAMPEP_0197195242 /NCGR_PEP_ID=MMETSP1423-20130617/30696_1 /TAXON_ID=476441 /ORGANISM="Pseudo-nitzschia heimii, Strain UNC1101" /LENGTH=2257 /DNA_ID=CAMNT_0042648825 /DNA_START=248 /DNA_END=7021 /DNA_ORIENTATION=-
MAALSLSRVTFFRLVLFLQLSAFAMPVDNVAEDDFADVNSIIGDVIVKLPQVPTMESGGYSIDLTDVICRKFSIRDASLTSRSVGLVGGSSSGVQIEWSIEGLAFECDAAYDYKGLLGVSNSGDVYLNSRGNQVTAIATVSAPLSGSPQAPTTVVMNSCTPEVEFVDIDFDNGGFIGWILDAIEVLLRTMMENIASEKICEELQTFLEGNTEELLKYIAGENVLKPYLQTPTTDTTMIVDPLQYEDNFIQKLMIIESSSTTKETSTATSPSTTTELLNLQNQDTSTGRWINQLIKKGVEASNELKSTLVNGIVKEELQVNQWLRDFVLEDNTGALVLSSSSSSANGFPDDGILYDSEDLVTYTTIVLDRVKLLGLDTLTEFSPLESIGKYTLGTSLAWRYLAFEIDVTMTVRPSTRPDSVIETTADPLAREIVEKVKMVLGVDGMMVDSSLMIALNQTALENSVELGSLLKSTETAADCFLSTILDLEFATFSLEVMNAILTPSIQGLVSPGLDRLVSDSMDALFLLYEEILMDAAPNYFQEKLRPLLTQNILHEYLLLHNESIGDNIYGGGKNNRKCLPYRISESVEDDYKTVDFRDLLLPAEEAIALGGSGLASYGDLLPGMLVPYFNKELFDTDALNAQLIPTLTKGQSGKEGVMEFNSVFQYFDVSPSSQLYDTIDFRISKVTISNLDTVGDPLELLQPVNSSNVLQSRFAFNEVADPLNNDLRFLNITFHAYLEINGDNSPFQMTNEVDFSLSIPSTSFSVGILANLKEKSFLQFPLKNIANPYCWLSTLGSPTENHTEIKADSKEDLAISSLSFFFSTFYMASTCVSASSPGCDSISEVINHLEEAGLASSFREPIINAVLDIAISFWDSLDITEMIKESPKHCSHLESYDSKAIASPIKVPNLSGISRETSETMIALGIIGLQTGIILSAKNHIILDNLLPAENNESTIVSATVIPIPEGREIIDWTNLTSQYDILFQGFREHISRNTILSSEDSIVTRNLAPETPESTLMLNNMLREYILDDSGYLDLEIKDLSFTLQGISLSVSKIRIGGLDTVSVIDPLVVVEPYKMRTALQINEVKVVVECDVTTTDGTALHQVGLLYEARDILIDIDTRIALNATKIGQIQVGSLFDTSKVVNCLMKGIQIFEISKLNLTLGEVQNSATPNSFSSNLNVELDRILNSLNDEYQEEILSAVPLVAGSTMRDIMNKLIPDILQSSAMECPTPSKFQSDGVIDFREFFLSGLESEKLGGKGLSSYGNLFQILHNMSNEELIQKGASNRPVLNDWTKAITKKQSNTTGTINIVGEALAAQSVIQIAGLRADLKIEVLDILIQNLDSVGDPLLILQPVDREANVLDNKLSFGVDSKPMEFEGTLVLSVYDGADMNIRNEINLRFLVEDVTVQATLLLKLLENSISYFPLGDIMDMNCWASTIFQQSNDDEILDGLQLLAQVYSTGDFEMEISCKSCTSPDFDKFLLSLYEPNDITAVIQEQTSSIMKSGYVQRVVKSFLIEAKKQCPHRSEFDPDYETSAISDSTIFSGTEYGSLSLEKKKKTTHFSITNSVIASCLIFIGIVGKFIIARRNKEWVLSLTNEGQILFQCQQEKQRKLDEWLDENTTSLFSSPHIPKSIRLGVPILILINTGLYLGGHFGLLSVVNLDITFAGQSFTVDEFLKFYFWESSKKTYENGGAEMIILLWICTGVWPYVKLILSLAIWMTPPKYLSVKRRRTLLLWIDALARLSVIDIFTLIIGFAILLVFIGGRDMSINEDEMYYSLKAIVVPKAGCYCIIVAQRMSRVSSQFFLEYHGRVVERATLIRKNKEGDLSVSSVLIDEHSRFDNSSQVNMPSRHVTTTNNNNCENSQPDLGTAEQLSRIPTDLSFFTITSWKAYSWGLLGAIFAGMTILIVFIIGLVFVPAIAFDISTIGGITLESELTYEEAASEYGVFLVLSGILLKARFVLKTKADYVGLGLLLLAAGISVALIFIIKSYHLIRQKIQERREKRNGIDHEPSYGHQGCGLPSYFRLYKWNHMEIYFISLCIGVWQLGSIVSYSIHLYCSILASIFEILTSIGVIESTDAQCNRVQASLAGNLVIAIGSSAILLVVFFLQAWGQYKKNLLHALNYVDDEDIPTLSLAWSEDKSKNTRYSHLTETLSLGLDGSDNMSSRAGAGGILDTNPSAFIFPAAGMSIQDSCSRSFFTASSARSNISVQHSPPCVTIEEDRNEDDILVPVASLVLDVANSGDHASTSIDATC